MTDSTLERARKALAAHQWNDAYDAFSSAPDEAMAGEELEALAEAAWWTAHPNECIDALERAYAAYTREGNSRRAAYVALSLAEQWSERLQSAQSAGWLQRAARLLEGQPEGVEHGYLELALARSSEGVEEMMQHGAAILDIGSRFEDRDLQAYGPILQGIGLVSQAKVDQGMTIVVCRNLADYRRAGEWTEATNRWCERQAISGFPGHCRARRAEIMRLRGAFEDAEEEAHRAVQDLIAFGDLPVAGVGFHEIGEIRLRIGDLDGAEEAFAEAHQRGNDAQPGLALLQLARGRPVAARSSIRAALADSRRW